MTDKVSEEIQEVEAETKEAPVLTVTPLAVQKIRELKAARNVPDHALRIFITGGGCSGLSYGMTFESNFQEFDTIIQASEDVKLVVDPMSLELIQGAHIDFVESLMGGGFPRGDPNALSTCGCGQSFSTSRHAAGDGGYAFGSCGCG